MTHGSTRCEIAGMDKWFEEIGPFLADMFRHTVGKLTGFLSILLGLAPVIYPAFFGGDKGVLHARTTWWTASAVAFFLASMAAWSEKNSEVKRCQKEILDRKPKFEMAILNLNREYVQNRNETNYMLSIVIASSGAPSVALGWGAVFKRQGIPDEAMSTRYLSQPYILRQPDGEIAITNPSLIQSRTLTNPLAFGDARTGRILFVLPGNRMQVDDFSIEVSCFDVLHNRCSSVFHVDPTPSVGIQFFPDEQVSAQANPAG